jgi:hypothetical protein
LFYYLVLQLPYILYNSQTIKDEAIADIKDKFNIDVACFPCGLKFLEVRAIARN